ncbi:MAG: threonine ammonia-lyase [Thermoanaerobaculia bacterium]|nr:threonine ammonia-lyase [Thermoanaerobaculia bacterium]
MVTLDDIRRARERIGDRVYESPCARSETFSRRCGVSAYFKLENLQMTGSFKERGALNKILQLDTAARDAGIIAASAGNHAQAVAYWGRAEGIPVTIVMPRRTPVIKVANTRDYGAEVVLEGDSFDDAYRHARELEAASGATFVHPFDDEDVIAGQGTIGLELLEQAPQLEMVVVPVGGGGLISGISVAIKSLRPEVSIVGVEAAAVPAMQESVAAGAPVTATSGVTIADGIAVKRPGALTLEYVKRHVDTLVQVDEEEIANAVLLLLEQEKTVTEGAGAVPLAALYNRHIPEAAGRHVVMVLSGGNIDVNILSRIIERGLAKDGRLVRITVRLSDEPGALAAVLETIGGQGGNVIEVNHDRTFSDLGLAKVAVTLTLETRGRGHGREIEAAIAEAGFEADRVPIEPLADGPRAGA